MYTLELDEETAEIFIMSFLQKEYKNLWQEELSPSFDDNHPEDQNATFNTRIGIEAVLKYYMVPSEAEKFFQDVADGKDEETLVVHMDNETAQKVFEASIYSAINNYLQEQKDAVKSYTHLGNTES